MFRRHARPRPALADSVPDAVATRAACRESPRTPPPIVARSAQAAARRARRPRDQPGRAAVQPVVEPDDQIVPAVDLPPADPGLQPIALQPPNEVQHRRLVHQRMAAEDNRPGFRGHRGARDLTQAPTFGTAIQYPTICPDSATILASHDPPHRAAWHGLPHCCRSTTVERQQCGARCR